MLEKIAELWQTEIKNLKSKDLEDKATFIYEDIRGGRQLIIGEDGKYLLVNSSVNFEQLLKRFEQGERNGKI